jgi:UDP-glucose 4-epimerase
MLKHNSQKPRQPKRVVILGATGFVGGETISAFERECTEILALGRAEIDLLGPQAGSKLARLLQPTDTFVMVSAEAPCKDAKMLIRNIQMMIGVCSAITEIQPAHVIYISSDAVYADSLQALTEASSAEPGSIHGAMHLSRELMIKDAVKNKLAILRPTLIYGINDPHNGYGPNQFRRLTEVGRNIVLFGKGEEQRDHILVDDVAELIRLIAWHKSSGILNAATGNVISFKEIAKIFVQQSGLIIEIKEKLRIGEMPHNGYRPFDIAATKIAFPKFRYTPLREGLALSSQKT